MTKKDYNKGSAVCYACSSHLPLVIKSPKIQIQLCEDCKLEDKTLISKSTALKDFILDEDDLINLACNTVCNKYSKDTKFYYYYDVFDKAVSKYGSIKEFSDIKSNKKRPKNIELDTIKVDRFEPTMQRKFDFMKKLPNINLSFLISCPEYNNYIKKGVKSGLSFDEVCHLVKNYYFLVENTNYLSLLNITGDFVYNEKLKDISLAYFLKSGGNPNIIPHSLIENSFDLLKNYNEVVLNYETNKNRSKIY